MTPIIKVLADFCAVYIDDIRLQDKAVENPPLYFRQMYQYFRPAIANFTLPAEMQDYLLGTNDKPNLIEPLFDDYSYTTNDILPNGYVLDLPSQYAGFDICNCCVKTGEYYENISIQYDTLGKVTLLQTIQADTKLLFDFYLDGCFKKDLSYDIMDILGTCFELVWQTRFNNDWLSNVSKVDDRSFTEQNRANKENADTERIREIRERLASKMRRFEQNKYYKQIVNPNNRLDI